MGVYKLIVTAYHTMYRQMEMTTLEYDQEFQADIAYNCLVEASAKGPVVYTVTKLY